MVRIAGQFLVVSFAEHAKPVPLRASQVVSVPVPEAVERHW
jgi:hypothetical protein